VRPFTPQAVLLVLIDNRRRGSAPEWPASHFAAPERQPDQQWLRGESGNVVPKAKAPAGTGEIKSHVLEVGRPDAQRVYSKTPGCRPSQRRGKWLNEPSGTSNLGDASQRHDRGRQRHPMRNNGEKWGGLDQMKRAGHPIKKCDNQPPDPLACKAPCTLQAGRRAYDQVISWSALPAYKARNPAS